MYLHNIDLETKWTKTTFSMLTLVNAHIQNSPLQTLPPSAISPICRVQINDCMNKLTSWKCIWLQLVKRESISHVPPPCGGQRQQPPGERMLLPPASCLVDLWPQLRTGIPVALAQFFCKANGFLPADWRQLRSSPNLVSHVLQPLNANIMMTCLSVLLLSLVSETVYNILPRCSG